MATSFCWTKQNNYSWRGAVNNTPYWIIITTDNTNFILQIPGAFSPEGNLKNLKFSSFSEAVSEAERLYNEEEQ